MATTAVASALAATPAQAQQSATSTPPMTQLRSERSFDIPAQPLTDALVAFGQQSGIQVTVDGMLARNVSSPAVSGTMTSREALNRLLAGSGLTYVVADETTVAIEKPGQQSGDGPIRTGPVTVRALAETKLSDRPFRTPGSSAYISREQIDRVPPSSPGDIFIETPGVVAAGNHDGTAVNVNIRNAQGLNRVRVMVEGTQQESSGYQGYAGPDQRTYVDPELIGGVEVTKGPGGEAYSSGTTGGIVNIRLLEADDLIREGRDVGLRLRGGLAGNGIAPRDFSTELNRDPALVDLAEDGNDILTDDNWFASVAGAYRTDRFDLVAAYARRKEGNYFAGKHGSRFTLVPNYFFNGEVELRERPLSQILQGQEVPNTSEDTESLLLKGTLRWTDGQSLEGGYTRYESDFGHVFPSSLNLFTIQQYPLNEVDSSRYWLRYRWESANDLINLQANVWRTKADELGEFRNVAQENEAWGAEIWNASFLETRLGALTLTYGAEYSVSQTEMPDPVGIFGRQYTPGLGPITVQETLPFTFDGERDVFGGYVNVALAPTDWLTLNAGVRYDSFDAESESLGNVCDLDGLDDLLAAETFDDIIAALFQLDGYCGATLVETENDADRFSPRAGITLEPLEGLQIFGQYSEGFRALSLVEMGQHFVFGFTANPDLRPERVRTWEAGVNYLRDGLLREGDAFRAKLVYYNNNYTDYIARSGSEFIPIVSFFDVFFENIPEANFAGIEASFYYDAGFIFADFTFNKFTEVEYCYVNNRLRDPETFQSLDPTFGCFNRPPPGEWIGNTGQPDYSGSATLGTRWFDETLVLGARLSFFGEPNHPIPGPEFNTVYEYWPSQEIVDLFGSYQFNDNVGVGFSVENLGNRYYVVPLSVTRIPAPGRTVRLNLTARF